MNFDPLKYVKEIFSHAQKLTLLHFFRSLIGPKSWIRFRPISDRKKWSKVNFSPRERSPSHTLLDQSLYPRPGGDDTFLNFFSRNCPRWRFQKFTDKSFMKKYSFYIIAVVFYSRLRWTPLTKRLILMMAKHQTNVSVKCGTPIYFECNHGSIVYTVQSKSLLIDTK